MDDHQMENKFWVKFDNCVDHVLLWQFSRLCLKEQGAVNLIKFSKTLLNTMHMLHHYFFILKPTDAKDEE